MKFSLFSDIHYHPGKYWSGGFEHLERIQKRAEAEGCEFIIHAGDLCHGPSLVLEYVEKYNSFHIPSYNCLGNHDSDWTPYEETLKYYNMPDGHYYFDHGGYRMIIVDPNYYYHDGEYVHYSMGNYFDHRDERDWMPPEQLEWLRETIDSSENPCVIIGHESFEREAGGVHNLADVRGIISDANAKRPHSVILVINGHLHRDNLRIIDNVAYFDVNSASYDYLPTAHDLFPEEFKKEYVNAGHMAVYNDPIHAVVTLEGTRIKIEGMESTFKYGVRREDTDNAVFDPMGRLSTARVLSADITLN